MPDIFISYAQEDAERIRPLVALFESQGWSVFWDRKILPGENWTTLIDQKLNACKAAVVVWSRNSIVSEWVKAEAMAARERGILVPVRIDQCQIPLPFGLVQTADVAPDAPDTAGTFRMLVAQISTLLAKTPANPDAVRHYATAQTQKSIFTRINWMHVLFEFYGRLSRRIFWLGMLVLLPVFYVLGFVIESIVRATHVGAPEATILEKSALAYTFITLYPSVAVTAKRLHDFNWSAWWALPPVLLYILLVPGQAMLFADPNDDEAIAAGMLLTLVIIAPFVLIGLIPGTRGPNRYGMPQE